VSDLGRPGPHGPPASNVDAGGPPRIRRARPDEAELLTGIAHAAKRHWGYPERWMELWRPLLTISPEEVAGCEFWVSELDGRVAGFHAVSVTGPEASLDHLWLRPEAMGLGIGRALFAHAAALAAQLGASTLVIDADPNAEGFYLRMGARRVGEIPADVDGTPRVLPRLELDVLPDPAEQPRLDLQ
jgi:GNAT superfamily N-acetyltransferase